LKTAQVHNAPGKWVRADGVIEPIVTQSLFSAAQRIVHERSRKLTQEEKLEPLRRLLRVQGRLTRDIIAMSPATSSVSSYQRWFGGLIPAYQLVGYSGYRKRRPRAGPFRSSHAATANLADDELVGLLRLLLQKHGYLSRRIIDEAEGIPSAGAYFKRFGSMARAYRLARADEHLGNPYRRGSRQISRSITFSLSNEQLLELLRRLLQERGKLSQEIINESGQTPRGPTYAYRFGSLKRAYELIGYRPARE
jgi:hypothetical protein